MNNGSVKNSGSRRNSRIIAIILMLVMVMCMACSSSGDAQDPQTQEQSKSAENAGTETGAGAEAAAEGEKAGAEAPAEGEKADAEAAAEGEKADAEAPAEPKDIVVLFTSDIHCGVDQGFGLAGLMEVRKSIEKDGTLTILVDNGDAIQGEPLGTLTTGEAITDLMNQAGYDIAIPGNHEFDYGMDRFLELVSKSNFPYISCNFNKEGNLVFEPFIIKEIGGRKIGFVGVTTPHTIRSSTPRYFQNENGEFIYGFMQDETGEALFKAVQDAVDKARAAGAERVFAMGHMGNEQDAYPYNYVGIVENTTGIDVFLDGHSHDTDRVMLKNKNGEDVFRTACGTKLQGIGWTRISAKDGSLTSGLYSWDNSVSVPELLGIDNEMKSAVDATKGIIDEKLAEVVAKSSVELTIYDPVAKSDSGVPIRIVRRSETNLGDLCADAYRDQLGADIAFVNGGGVRGGINKGDITLGDIIMIHPYGNRLCMVNATGRQILDALEWGARMTPNETGSFLQVSGITYEIDTSVESHCTQDVNGMFTGVDGEYRVKNVMVGGEPLDLKKTYKLGGHNYMLKNSGDGYTMFGDCELLLDEVMIDNQALINYITGTLGGEIGSEYADPYGDGRILAIE
ncbi:MAG: bifunctional metallophosphatase/5'-nucleotidase [Lachnospiraceae bacterium]|nr:bifunctional metallophosphatase/5'-nucleotidase [Lachnospiraceae bacterium]